MQTLRHILLALSVVIVLLGVGAGVPLSSAQPYPEEQRALIEDIAFAHAEVLAVKKPTDRPITEEQRTKNPLAAMQQAIHNDYQRKYLRLMTLCKRYYRRYGGVLDKAVCPLE